MGELKDRALEEPKSISVRKKHSPGKERLGKKIIREREEEEKIEKTKSKRLQFVIEILMSIVAIALTWFLSNKR